MAGTTIATDNQDESAPGIVVDGETPAAKPKDASGPGAGEGTGGSGGGGWGDGSPDSGIAVDPSSPNTDPHAAGKTLLQGAVEGVTHGATVAGGMYAGGVAGAAAGTAVAPGVGTTVGAVGGAIIGGFGGSWAGDIIQRGLAKIELPSGTPLTFPNMESVPLNLRKYAVAGETFGSTLPFIGLPYTWAKTGFRFADNLVGRFFNRVIEGAAEHPISFGAIELQSALAAGAAGGGAQEAAPGNPYVRTGAEIVGGTFNPGRWVMSAARNSFRMVRSGVESLFHTPARESAVQDELFRILHQFGEDPKAVAAAIREHLATLPGVHSSAGITADSPGLIALEAKLQQESAKFGSESQQMAQDSLDSIRGLIAALQKSGSPEALKLAAQVRSNYFNTLMNTRLHSAEQAALETAANINPANPRSRAAFGVTTQQVMDSALEDVRAVERENWAKVPQDLPGEASNVLHAIDAIKANRLPEEALPPIVEGFARRMKGEDIGDLPEETQRLIEEAFGGAAKEGSPATTTGELILLRSRMLTRAREAAAQHRMDDARVYGQIGEAALEDLSNIMVADPEAAHAYQAARDWSRQLNDTFMRTFVGDTLATNRAGATRIPPELVMAHAFGTGKELGDLHFRQLEEAARMAGHEHVSRLLDQQERTIRFAAHQTINPQTGRVDAGRLAKFRRDNSELLARFPEVDQHLSDAQRAQEFLQQTEQSGRRGMKNIKQSAAFSQVLGHVDPAVAVRGALTGKNPALAFKRMVTLAQRGGQDAVEGLKSSVYSYAYDHATSESGSFSFDAYRRAWTTPLYNNGPSLQELMVGHGLIDAKDVKLMNRFLDRGSLIESAVRGGGQKLDQIMATGDALFDLSVRLMGSRAASLLPLGSANGLIVGGAGVRFAQHVMSKVPLARQKDMLMELVKDPGAMAALLERPATPKMRMQLARQLNAYLYSWTAQEND